MMRAVAVPLAVVLLAAPLAACDNPKPRDPPPPLPVAQPPAAEPAAAVQLPAWADGLVGKPLTNAYPEPSAICVGNADNVQSKSAGGAELVGWGWDPQAKAPISRVLLVDASGVIVGAGEPGIPRPDVNAARPEITSPDTGWSARTARTSGAVDVLGVVGEGAVVCRLGRLELG